MEGQSTGSPGIDWSGSRRPVGLLGRFIKHRLQELLRQQQALRCLVIAVVAVLATLTVALAAANRLGIGPEQFTRDPVVLLGGDPWTGILSNLGILGWAFAAAATCFAGMLKHRRNRSQARFLFSSAGISLTLLLDDLFLLHDVWLPEVFRLGEKAAYLGYFLAVAGFLIFFFRRILTTEYLLLTAALLFFAVSVVVDMLLPQRGWVFLLEDGAKLLGIVLWATYFLKTSFLLVKRPYAFS